MSKIITVTMEEAVDVADLDPAVVKRALELINDARKLGLTGYRVRGGKLELKAKGMYRTVQFSGEKVKYDDMDADKAAEIIKAVNDLLPSALRAAQVLEEAGVEASKVMETDKKLVVVVNQ